TRKRANLIANRLSDLFEEGEIILDGAHRTVPTNWGGTSVQTPEGEVYTAVGSAGWILSYSASGKNDVADYAAFEGDNAMLWGHSGPTPAAGDGWEIDVSGRTTASSAWT